MKYFPFTLLVTALLIALAGCGAETASQSASSSELQQYLQDHPDTPADEVYDVD